MSKLVVTTFVTLDGVMQAPGGPDEDRSGGFEHEGWVVPHFDDAAGAFMVEVFDRVGSFLLGRKTYDIFTGYWPHVTDENDPIASRLNSLPKYVASRSLDTAEWHLYPPSTGAAPGHGALPSPFPHLLPFHTIFLPSFFFPTPSAQAKATPSPCQGPIGIPRRPSNALSMRSVVDWIAMPASGVNCSMRRAMRSGNAPRNRSGRKSRPTPVAIVAPEWRRIVPMPSAMSAYAVRRRRFRPRHGRARIRDRHLRVCRRHVAVVVEQRLRAHEADGRGDEREREDDDAQDERLRREHAEPSLGRGQRRPDHPARELRGDERGAGDDHRDLREHDPASAPSGRRRRRRRTPRRSLARARRTPRSRP